MKERPIIQGYEIAGRMPVFQQWGRQAIRNGQKTQTRRPLRKQPLYVDEAPRYLPNEWCLWDGECSPNGDIVRCPHGKSGDIRVMTEPLINIDGLAHYLDDERRFPAIDNQTNSYILWRWKPKILSSLFMPYEAARTLTRYTNVRVERVQKIKPSDCEGEGITGETLASPVRGQPYEEYSNGDGLIYTSPKLAFAALWDSLNAKRGYSWESNPYVWVVEFERIK